MSDLGNTAKNLYPNTSNGGVRASNGNNRGLILGIVNLVYPVIIYNFHSKVWGFNYVDMS